MKRGVKVGDKFYSISLIIESARNDKSFLEVEEWIVTKIIPTGIYLKEKVDKVTWGKLSTKKGDYGFLPNVPDYCKKFIESDISFESQDLYKTKIGASKAQLPYVKKKISELNRIATRLEKLSESAKIK